MCVNKSLKNNFGVNLILKCWCQRFSANVSLKNVGVNLMLKNFDVNLSLKLPSVDYTTRTLQITPRVAFSPFFGEDRTDSTSLSRP